MDAVQSVLVWIATNVFGQVAILIGLITLLGLLLQRKPVEDVVAGALRSVLGIIILFVGVDLFTGGLADFQAIVSSAVGLDPPSATNTLDGFLGSHGGTVALIITVGFLIHMVLVAVFPAARYVYLTGHLMFWVSVVITACLVQVFGDLPQLTLVIVGSILIASYWTLQPMWIAPFMRKVTGRDEFALGHTTSVLALVTAVAARPLGDPEKHSTEKLRMPRQLSFFKDVNVSTALVIGLILIISMLFADGGVVREAADNYEEGISTGTWGVIAAFRFAAGIAILLFGVRMFLGEIVPAFKGVSDKLVPGSRPALDIPTVFPMAPTAVMLGFVSSTAVFLVLLGVFAGFGWFTLVPPMIMLFFGGGAGGIFGNAVAGWRGAVLGGVLNGIMLAIGQAITWSWLSDTAPELATLADPDWYMIMAVLIGIGQITGPLGVAGVWSVAIIFGLLTVVILTWLSFFSPAGRAHRAQGRTAETTEEQAAAETTADKAEVTGTSNKGEDSDTSDKGEDSGTSRGE